MKTISICGKNVKNIISDDSFIEPVNIAGVSVNCGLIHTKDIEFDRHAVENRERVLIKIIAFSCNYRDKAIILSTATQANSNTFNAVGSDFVAEVIEVGTEVTDFKPGDRVINNNAYPHSGAAGVKEGVPTNHGSKEYRILHQVKLIKIPAQMPDEVAAGFSIGAQTSYSMMRKLDLHQGDRVLVTAARSNTSLFVVNALQKYRSSLGVKVYATTTSPEYSDRLIALGIDRLIPIDTTTSDWLKPEVAQEIMLETGGFNGIIDPFFDIHLPLLIHTLVNGGKYITCGFHNQYQQLLGGSALKMNPNLADVMAQVIINNLQIIGNCIGFTSDLEQAIEDYTTGKLSVIVDSVYSDRQIKDFFHRTYNSNDRFGKVIYKYAPDTLSGYLRSQLFQTVS